MAIKKLKFYSKKNCVQCMGAARTLASTGATGVVGTGINVDPVELEGGLPVEVIKLDNPDNAHLVDELKEKGFGATPILSFVNEDGETEIAFAGNDIGLIHSAVGAWRDGK